MNTYEINQIWGNEFNTATITAVDTSYDDTYLTYTVDNRTCATNAQVFAVLFPTAMGTSPSTTYEATATTAIAPVAVV